MALLRFRTIVGIGLTLIVAVAIGAMVVSWWLKPADKPPLEHGWTATVRVIAGTGASGVRDGDAERASFSDPFGVAVGATGNVFIADAGTAQRIRVLTPTGMVSTLAGGARGFADGVGSAAQFDTPSGLAIDANGTLYVADTANNAIRRITPDGHVTTLAGDGVAGYIDGPVGQARFNAPIGIAVDSAGRVIVADTYNDRIRAISTDGIVSTIAEATSFDTPVGVAVDGVGTIYVADTGNGAVRVVAPSGDVSTIDLALADLGVQPHAIATTPLGEIFVTDGRGRVVEISREWTARVVAGSAPGFGDGPGDVARFRRPFGVAIAERGRLIISDSGNRLVRSVSAVSQLQWQLPASPLIAPRFDDHDFATHGLLWPVTPMEGPHEIAGTMGEARGEGADRLHAGIDVRAEQGTPVYAVRDASVATPIAAADFDSLNERVSIGPVEYVHIRVGRLDGRRVLDPARFVPTYGDKRQLTRVRVKRGARFRTGELVGSVNNFNHVHLNIGWPGEEYNPLRFRLVQFVDTVAPVITRGGLRLFDDQSQLLTARQDGRLLVSGRLQIVVDAWDQVDGNRPGRRLGLYELGYQVINPDGTPVAAFGKRRDTIRFDRLNDSEAPRLVYAPGSGIPFYGGRTTRFLYVASNRFRHGIAATDVWDAGLLPPGDYVLRIRAADISGNEAMANRDVNIRVVPSATHAPPPVRLR